MNRIATVVLVMATLAGASQAAVAAEAAGPAASAPLAAVADACRDDVQKLCPGVQPGEGRIAACLRDKRRQLSDGCKAALKDERQHRKAGPK